MRKVWKRGLNKGFIDFYDKWDGNPSHLLKFFNKEKTSIKLGNNLYLAADLDNKIIALKYHFTTILYISVKSERCRIFLKGYDTWTTLQRINLFIRKWKYDLVKSQGKVYLTFKGKKMPFKEGIVLPIYLKKKK